MWSTTFVLVFAVGAAAYQGNWKRIDSSSNATAVSTAGFTDAEIVSSSNGSAICIQGNVAVYAATTKNLDITIPVSAITNQTVVTETVVEVLMAGSTFMDTAVKGMASVSGTYNINAQLCYPRATGINASSVQLLTHGIGFEKSYWDIAPGYSYIDAAAASGYTTFSYDRLCTGLSDHPDAHQVCQAPLEMEIAHSLAMLLRNGTFSGTSFSAVIGVGHSFGSALTQGITAAYPTVLDAAVLTGYTLNATGLPTFMTSLDLTIAKFVDPIRFSNLSNGYLVSNNYFGAQFAFFKAQGFPPMNLALAEANKQTVTFGELLSLAGMQSMPASNFTGPVDVVDGANDWPYCLGNCSVPMDLSKAVVPALYPMVNVSESLLVSGTGHGINAHYGAGAALAHIQGFVKSCGF